MANSLGTGGSSLIHPSFSFPYQLVESPPHSVPARIAGLPHLIVAGVTSDRLEVWDGAFKVDKATGWGWREGCRRAQSALQQSPVALSRCAPPVPSDTSLELVRIPGKYRNILCQSET